MHHSRLGEWQHKHSFNRDKKGLETVTLVVVVITFLMMIAEIFFGWLTNSMALFADGWHMGTHAFALGISVIAYAIARKQSENARFTFGTWKIEILGAYTSALILGMVALIMAYTSVERLLHPLNIIYNEAIFVAIIGLVVNLVCIAVLSRGSASHADEHPSHNDLNFHSAYLHVIADSMTSVFAIVALLGAKFYSLNWLDPFMGLVGAFLIGRWSAMLLKDSAWILLDHQNSSPLSREIKKLIESDGDSKVCDLHLLQVADEKYAGIVSIVTGKRYPVEYYKKKLNKVHELTHVTIEINKCKVKQNKYSLD
ncbi:MAG: CDF family Co(II)/Ni(II) efflux transporter DmeF [Candidatus Altiarchaeales archaeon]|nr:CDF family Co(II)/Ni(II) efflux transporter DmeF [Candidatus Altiarchaeales archaeon]